jgi:sugar phosphate isomerase/epimerase
MVSPHVHVPYHKIGEHFSFLKENRINLEIYFSSHSLDYLKDDDILDLKERLDYSPSLSLHAPFMDLSPGAVDKKVRDVTIERFSQVFEIAGILKPKVVVFHSGYEKWKYAKRVDIWLEESLKTWTPFIEKAKDIGTKIAIENIFEDQPLNLRLLMDKLVSEHFGLCFDTGHFNIFSESSLNEWLQQLQSYIIELHLHDNYKTSDDHNAIGDGTFDFDTLFAVLRKKDLIYTVEAHNPEGALNSIAQLQKYI